MTQESEHETRTLGSILPETKDDPSKGPLWFVDRFDRKWDCTLTAGGALRIDNSDFSAITKTEFSVLVPDKEFFTLCLGDTRVLLAMVWALVQPQTEAHGVQTEDDFLEGFNGKTIGEARRAFWRALADFFQDRETTLLSSLKTWEGMEALINAKSLEIAPEIAETMVRMIEEKGEALKRELNEKLGTGSM